MPTDLVVEQQRRAPPHLLNSFQIRSRGGNPVGFFSGAISFPISFLPQRGLLWVEANLGRTKRAKTVKHEHVHRSTKSPRLMRSRSPGAAWAFVIVMMGMLPVACQGGESALEGQVEEGQRTQSPSVTELSKSDCKTLRARPVHKSIGPAVGEGPAYAVLGGLDGVVNLRDAVTKRGRFFSKVLWAVAPSYRGPVTVKAVGEQGEKVGFDVGGRGHVRERLHIGPADGKGWRYLVSSLASSGAEGCYHFNVRLAGSRQQIPFAIVE